MTQSGALRACLCVENRGGRLAIRRRLLTTGGRRDAPTESPIVSVVLSAAASTTRAAHTFWPHGSGIAAPDQLASSCKEAG